MVQPSTQCHLFRSHLDRTHLRLGLEIQHYFFKLDLDCLFLNSVQELLLNLLLRRLTSELGCAYPDLLSGEAACSALQGSGLTAGSEQLLSCLASGLPVPVSAL